MLFTKTKQISESHCGPAVLQMLLDLIGVNTTQENLTKAADAEATIEEHGLRIDQLGLAVARVAPQTQFWFKHHNTLSDVRQILRRGYICGVEWQSLFYDTPEEEVPGGDYGHYSIILDIDDNAKTITMVDPYKDYIESDRTFDIEFFLRRWWDDNIVADPTTGELTKVIDEQMAFFVTDKEKNWPAELGFKRFELSGDSILEDVFEPVADHPLLLKMQRMARIKGFLQGKVRKTE